MKPLLIVTASYLLGSLPFAVWIGRFRSGPDPRLHGSRNPGATNILRLHGWPRALVVLFLDLAKGWVAVAAIAGNLAPGDGALACAAGLAAIVGHLWPLLAGFRGGKGVATAAGVFLALDGVVLAMALGLFVLVVGLSRRVSPGSVAAALVLPLFGYLQGAPPPQQILSGLVALLIVWTHRSNLRLLWQGREPRWSAGRRGGP